jgi:hypothetical protein
MLEHLFSHAVLCCYSHIIPVAVAPTFGDYRVYNVTIGWYKVGATHCIILFL